ncbi:hypothetical protein K1719_016134 [Acacia pycnantha]|nr:hypothetical protein K1719_016134 [Acacia pycnantha]
MPPTRVVSLLQCDYRSNNWSTCVKVIGHFWDIPSQRRHKHLTYNAVITDAEGYVALAVVRRRDLIRRFAGVLTTGLCFILRKFSVERGKILINPDMTVVLDTFTQVELVGDIITTPGTMFQPLLPFAATTFTEPSLINVIGLVTSVYGMADIVVDGETESQFNFEIMDESGNAFYCCFRGSAAFWALDSYSRVGDKDDVVVALFWVKMTRLSDGDILFSSHCELSKARFNYNHPAIFAFRSSLDRAVADNVGPSPDSTTS